MTHASDRDHAAIGEASTFVVREEHDPEVVRSLLSEDPSFAAFALGHLEPELLPFSRFWTAEGPGGRSGIVMHARANLGRTTVLTGDADAVEAVLSLHPGPRGGYLATCAPEHVAVVERVYELGDPLRMMRMTVQSHGFSDPMDSSMRAVRRLVRADARQLNALYATGDGPTGYRGEHIERGVSGAVTRELFARGCSTVTLTVDPENTPAVRAYQRLGYEAGSPIVEARIRRRDVIGFGAMFRRIFARRGEDGEALVRASVRPDDGRAGRSEP